MMFFYAYGGIEKWKTEFAGKKGRKENLGGFITISMRLSERVGTEGGRVWGIKWTDRQRKGTKDLGMGKTAFIGNLHIVQLS